jgi:hypothetical protein
VAAVAAKTKELLPIEPPKKKRRWPKRLAIFAGILAAGGAAFVAARKFLGGSDDEWSSRPATPYASTTITEPQPSAESTPAGDPAAASASTAPEPDDVAAGETAVTDAEPRRAQDAEEAADAEGASAPEAGYGEGSYVGTEPPEGFTIKGNERSMKYHVPDAAGYDRTNAEVWFNSEAAAEAAGFTRAQR